MSSWYEQRPASFWRNLFGAAAFRSASARPFNAQRPSTATASTLLRLLLGHRGSPRLLQHQPSIAKVVTPTRTFAAPELTQAYWLSLRPHRQCRCIWRLYKQGLRSGCTVPCGLAASPQSPHIMITGWRRRHGGPYHRAFRGKRQYPLHNRHINGPTLCGAGRLASAFCSRQGCKVLDDKLRSTTCNFIHGTNTAQYQTQSFSGLLRAYDFVARKLGRFCLRRRILLTSEQKPVI